VPPDVPRLDAEMGALRLSACDCQPQALSARDDLLHPPSGWVHVTTYWTLTNGPLDIDLYPSARLVDDIGQVWGDKLERPNDAIHIWPTSRWQPEEVVRADYDVNLNPITPPGTYRLVIEVPGVAGQAVCGEVGVVSNE